MYIKTEEQYQAALKRADELLPVVEGDLFDETPEDRIETPESIELDNILAACAVWENDHHAIDVSHINDEEE